MRFHQGDRFTTNAGEIWVIYRDLNGRWCLAEPRTGRAFFDLITPSDRDYVSAGDILLSLGRANYVGDLNGLFDSPILVREVTKPGNTKKDL